MDDLAVYKRFILDEIEEMRQYAEKICKETGKSRAKVIQEWVTNKAGDFRRDWFIKNASK